MQKHSIFHKVTLLPLISPVRYYGEKTRQDTDELFSQALQTYKMKIASMPPHTRVHFQMPTSIMMSTHPTN